MRTPHYAHSAHVAFVAAARANATVAHLAHLRCALVTHTPHSHFYAEMDAVSFTFCLTGFCILFLVSFSLSHISSLLISSVPSLLPSYIPIQLKIKSLRSRDWRRWRGIRTGSGHGMACIFAGWLEWTTGSFIHPSHLFQQCLLERALCAARAHKLKKRHGPPPTSMLQHFQRDFLFAYLHAGGLENCFSSQSIPLRAARFT